MPPESADQFSAHLLRMRRRLMWIALARNAAFICGGAILSAEAALLAVRDSAWPTVPFVVGTGAAAALAGVVAVVVRSPSSAATAALLDRRWQLEDRTVTAFELRGSGDAVSRLVVEDAARHLASRGPSGLPFEPLQRLPAIVAVVLAASALLASPGGRAWQPAAGVLPGASSSGPAAGTGRGNARVTPTSPAVGHVADAGRAVDGAPVPQARELRPVARPGVPGVPQRGHDVAAAGESAQSPATGASSGSDSSERPPADSGTTSGAGEQGTATGRQGDRGGAGDGQGGSGGADGAAASRQGPGAGGGGALRDRNAGAATSVMRGNPNYAARYRDAARHLESVVAQDRIPAERRAQVRDYFLAIRPVEGP